MQSQSPPESVVINGIAIPQAFIDSLPSGEVNNHDVKHLESRLTRFKHEVPLDHMDLVKNFQASVEQSPADEPEGVEIELTYSASVVLPSMGQCVVIRERNGSMRPLFLHLPTAGNLYDAQLGTRPITRKKKFTVYTKIPHPKVAGLMVPRLLYNQELMILNIYKSPYGVSFQLHTLEGIPEPITNTIEMYGVREWQREWFAGFTGIDLPFAQYMSFKTDQYKALPLGTFTEMYEVVFREIRKASEDLPKQVRWSMSQLFMEACRAGGHDPFSGKRDAEYTASKEELSKEDFFPALTGE